MKYSRALLQFRTKYRNAPDSPDDEGIVCICNTKGWMKSYNRLPTYRVFHRHSLLQDNQFTFSSFHCGDTIGKFPHEDPLAGPFCKNKF